ncbi:MAG: RluA family pseudouridine synthase [Bacteroidia bacterium]|nr:RluA family pseudouridine synthase [Bacteroidia bacterium]
MTTPTKEIPEDEQELFEHYRFVIDKGQELLRIDKFLMNRIENATRTKIQQAAESDAIHANNKPVKSSYKVKPGDVITIMLAEPPREIELIPQNIPITIVYEDADIIIVNKQAGMVVHPAYGNYKDTLMNALVYHFENLPVPQSYAKAKSIQQHPEINQRIRPGLVHRIDKNTSGLLVIAKTETAMHKLSKFFFNHAIDRTYQALVWGDFKENEGTITGNIGRSLKDRKKMDVFPDGEHGKTAITHYKVLERFGYVTLIECTLETGRTHQIRAHMKYAGHPVFNDEVYGGDKILKGTTFTKYKQFVENCFKLIPRHALHAKSLGFAHPSTGKKVYFESDLPEDLDAVIKKWKAYTINKITDE